MSSYFSWVRKIYFCRECRLGKKRPKKLRRRSWAIPQPACVSLGLLYPARNQGRQIVR